MPVRVRVREREGVLFKKLGDHGAVVMQKVVMEGSGGVWGGSGDVFCVCACLCAAHSPSPPKNPSADSSHTE